ncbi:hypothetical protein CC78DRAFT_529387 [Lojkania enalia]|uniref:Uncharacterized protein n=1 Tax=Lojkania enalia TaxID=147567 RepID=A0A9P4N9K5_9PLEO|nr:hypothetical protein CC78DRAFT_529387 [Didymosphaeria enalia]
MAPRRGGGGGGGGGGGISSDSCPGAFASDKIDGTPLVFFIAYCFYFVVTLIIMIAMSKVKKRHPNAKKILGALYSTGLSFLLLSYALKIVGTMLRECDTTPWRSYFNWAISWSVFDQLAYFILLVLVFYIVNDAIRERIGENPSYFKIIYGAVLGIMGALTAAIIGVVCYNLWTLTEDGKYEDSLSYEEGKLGTAYYVLFLLSVLGAGALSIVNIMSMKAKNINPSGLLGSILALTFSMFIWVLFLLVEYAAYLNLTSLERDFYYAALWIIDGFIAISFIILLFVAKSVALEPLSGFLPRSEAPQAPVYTATPAYPPQQPTYAQVPQQQQYAYNTTGQTQTYYFPQGQAPTYSNGAVPVQYQPYTHEAKA